jgi:hypothetical protein
LSLKPYVISNFMALYCSSCLYPTYNYTFNSQEPQCTECTSGLALTSYSPLNLNSLATYSSTSEPPGCACSDQTKSASSSCICRRSDPTYPYAAVILSYGTTCSCVPGTVPPTNPAYFYSTNALNGVSNLFNMLDPNPTSGPPCSVCKSYTAQMSTGNLWPPTCGYPSSPPPRGGR